MMIQLFFFGLNDEFFFIRLHWEKWINLSLYDGEHFKEQEQFFRKDFELKHKRKWDSICRYRKKRLKQIIFSMLTSESPEKRKTAALISGQEKYLDAIPLLNKLIEDNEYRIITGDSGTRKFYYVRQAAEEALEKMNAPVDNIIIEIIS